MQRKVVDAACEVRHVVAAAALWFGADQATQPLHCCLPEVEGSSICRQAGRKVQQQRHNSTVSRTQGLCDTW